MSGSYIGDVPNVKDVSPLDHVNVQVTLGAVYAEICRQDVLARSGKFGGTHILPSGPNLARFGVLGEEVGEVGRECNEQLMGRYDKENLVKELVQVAACAVAWATALESGTS